MSVPSTPPRTMPLKVMARAIAISGESGAEWRQYAKGWIQELRTKGVVESTFAIEAAAVTWRLYRELAAEKNAIDQSIDCHDEEIKMASVMVIDDMLPEELRGQDSVFTGEDYQPPKVNGKALKAIWQDAKKLLTQARSRQKALVGQRKDLLQMLFILQEERRKQERHSLEMRKLKLDLKKQAEATGFTNEMHDFEEHEREDQEAHEWAKELLDDPDPEMEAAIASLEPQ